jgi:hypothetical protein
MFPFLLSLFRFYKLFALQLCLSKNVIVPLGDGSKLSVGENCCVVTAASSVAGATGIAMSSQATFAAFSFSDFSAGFACGIGSGFFAYW